MIYNKEFMQHFQHLIINYFEVNQDEDGNCSITYTDATTTKICNGVELFQILTHEYTYHFLEEHNADEIEDLSEDVKNDLLQELESLKAEYKDITGQEYTENLNNDFGKVLKEVRLYRNLSKSQLGRDICDIRTISRIENGDINCPVELLDYFSEELCFDFGNFRAEINYCKTLDTYFVSRDFFVAITKADFTAIKNIIPKMENNKEFATGHNLQILYYAKAVVTTMLDKDIKKSNDYCLKGVVADGKPFSLDDLPLSNYTHIEQTLLHTYGYNLKIQGRYEEAKKIFGFILGILEDYPKTKFRHYYKYAEKEKNLYMSCIQNLSAIAYLQKEYEQGLSYTQKGFKFICNHNLTFFMPIILQKEFCLLCRLERYEEAVKTYDMALYIAERMENETLTKSLKADYQELILDNPNVPK